MKIKSLLTTLATVALALCLSSVANAEETEKCYGAVGVDESQVKEKGSDDGVEWILVEKGVCEQLENGSLEPSEE